MADSRKLFFVLAVIALFSVSGYAAAFNCVGNPGANPILRAGGITELIGDVQLTCSGDYATPTVTASFAVAVTSGSTTVTNRTYGHDAVVGGYLIKAAAEVKDSSGVNVIQVVQGFLSDSHSNIVLFPNVMLPTGTTSNVRFTNIRVLTTPVTSTLSPITVYANVSTAQANFAVTNALQSVGVIYPTLVFSVTSCSGGAAPSLAYQQCISQPPTAGALSFGVKFKEDISTSVFRNRRGAGAQVANVAYEEGNHGNPVRGFNTYTYATAGGAVTFPAEATIVSITDVADQATRLMVRFTNVPQGVNLYVTNGEIKGETGVPGTLSAAATLVAPSTLGSTAATCGVDADGHAIPVTNNAGTALGLTKVAQDQSGNYYAIYEVTANNENAFETLRFGVEVQYDADPATNTPETSTTSGTISGLFAPISAVTTADPDAAIPRFLDNPVTSNSPFSIGPCVTNLLFPYVTTTDGYATGLAIVNTSKDNVSTGSAAPKPFNTSGQTGTATLYFFGVDAPEPVVTPAIAPGAMYTAVVNDLKAGFSGYVIARTNFQYAHGLAFLLTPNGNGSEYLALVIPDRSGTVRVPDPFTTAGSGSGEQLTN
jgi:hypothetical protein